MNKALFMRTGLAAAAVLAAVAMSGPGFCLGYYNPDRLRAIVVKTVNEDPRIKTPISLDDVKLGKVKTGAFTYKWDAETPVGPYSCVSDDMLRSPTCYPAKSKVASDTTPANK